MPRAWTRGQALLPGLQESFRWHLPLSCARIERDIFNGARSPNRIIRPSNLKPLAQMIKVAVISNAHRSVPQWGARRAASARCTACTVVGGGVTAAVGTLLTRQPARP